MLPTVFGKFPHTSRTLSYVRKQQTMSVVFFFFDVEKKLGQLTFRWLSPN